VQILIDRVEGRTLPDPALLVPTLVARASA
jgi:hypothetical protein